MSAGSTVLWFLGWTLVIIPFEVGYWALSRVATCKVPKHELVCWYWLVAGFAVFVALDRSLSGHELVLAALVAGLHCALCDQFTKGDRRSGGRPSTRVTPSNPCSGGQE
jgi:hypothetical protein